MRVRRNRKRAAVESAQWRQKRIGRAEKKPDEGFR
jgi:hypothetical protein